ncbi:MAG: MFS transporter, partial [Rhodospirillales bacterium]
MSTISTPSGELKQSRTPIIAISVGHGSLHWVTAILFVMVPFMKKEFDWSYTEVTVLWAIFNASSAIANIPSGAAADIFGRRVLLMAVSLALCGGGM